MNDANWLKDRIRFNVGLRAIAIASASSSANGEDTGGLPVRDAHLDTPPRSLKRALPQQEQNPFVGIGHHLVEHLVD